MSNSEITKRRGASQNAGFRKDDLEWELFLKRWYRDNNQYKQYRARDFTIFTDQLKAFSDGAKSAGYLINVIGNDKTEITTQCGPSLITKQVDVTVVEVVFP